MINLAIYGAGGHGRETMPLLRYQAKNTDQLFFVDGSPLNKEINDVPVLSFDEFADIDGEKMVALSIGNGAIRRRLAEKCVSKNVGFLEIRARNVVEMDFVEIGDGAILSPFVTLTSNINIGHHFQANLYSYITHDCIIGDFVTFGPAVHCNGGVTIGSNAYIGTSATIKQGLTIGSDAKIGMGAVVTKNVPDGEIWVGNPAIKLR